MEKNERIERSIEEVTEDLRNQGYEVEFVGEEDDGEFDMILERVRAERISREK